MAFNVGDIVHVPNSALKRHGSFARVRRVLPKRLSQQDFQEYVVEFSSATSERFRFCLYREFELRADERTESAAFSR